MSSKRSRYRKTQARKVKRGARTLQTSTFMPKSRTVTISDTRNFALTDNGSVTLDHEPHNVPLMLCLNVNDPAQMWKRDKQGSWLRSDFGGFKTDGMPGLSKWVTNSGGDGPGLYRFAAVTKTKVTITVRPTASIADPEYIEPAQPAGVLPGSHATAAKSRGLQAVCRCVLSKVTAAGDLPTNRSPNNAFNADERSRKPYTISADVYNTRSGTAKGVTMTSTYTHRAMNAQSPVDRTMIFANAFPTAPGDKDFMYFAILPTHQNWHRTHTSEAPALGWNTCGKFQVCVQIDCTLKLSEPNTSDNALLPNEGTGAFDQVVPR